MNFDIKCPLKTGDKISITPKILDNDEIGLYKLIEVDDEEDEYVHIEPDGTITTVHLKSEEDIGGGV